MLVLSRRLKERILFPGIGASVQVLACKKGVVRLGIEAPLAVAVLRQEPGGQSMTADRPRPRPGTGGRALPRPGQERRTCRQLRLASIGLGMVRLHLRTGRTADAEATLARVHEEVQQLRRQLEGSTKKTAAPAPPIPGRRRGTRKASRKRAVLATCLS